MSESRRQLQTPTHDAAQDAHVRAERVRAMLARWAREDVGDEPEWDVDVRPLGMHAPDDAAAHSRR